MKILIVGDVCGRPGRAAFAKYTPELKKKYAVDVVIVNGENSAGGKGITRKSLEALYHGGADIITTGNHVWDKKEVLDIIDAEPFLIRPANYPEGTPGKGWCVYPFKAKNIGVLNLSGRAFMPPMDCPFQRVEDVLHEMQEECDVLILDMHAETTSEKMAPSMPSPGSACKSASAWPSFCITGSQTSRGRLTPSDFSMAGNRKRLPPPINISRGIRTRFIIAVLRHSHSALFGTAEGHMA